MMCLLFDSGSRRAICSLYMLLLLFLFSIVVPSLGGDK